MIVKGLRRERSNLFLGLILFILALELLNAWGMQVHYHSSPDSIPFWNLQTYLILPPSVWFFAQITTSPDYIVKKKYLLFYLPAVTEVIIQLSVSIYRRFTGEHLPSLLDNPAWFFMTEILPIIGMAIVLGVYGYRLFFFYKSLKSQSSHLNIIQYLRIFGLFSFLLALTLLWTAGVILELPVFAGIETILTLFLLIFGYIGYFDPTFFSLPILSKEKPSEKSEFVQYDDKKQLERLMVSFREDALHTQSKLTLEEVAAKLHLPPRYVSYLINTHCSTNFSNFINTFRVEEVIRKLGDPKEQHKTLLALALEAGFNSKSTFNQVFKQHTGKSPSHYLLVQKQ